MPQPGDSDFEGGEELRLILMEDDLEYSRGLVETVRDLGHYIDVTSMLDEFKALLQTEEREGRSYDVALLDMNIATGSKRIETPIGKRAIRYVKQNYPHIACIMISGSLNRPEEVLDLRDDYDLDYYISKDRVDEGSMRHALEKALKRVNPAGNTERRRQILAATLEKVRGNRLKWRYNLSLLEEREAMQGMLVDVETKNQIALYAARLRECDQSIVELEQELGTLS